MTSSSKSKYIQIKDYILKEDIGEGNFGKVKLGVSKTTNEEYAIKIINKDQIKIKMKNKIFRENEVITKFNHINVIFVFEIIEDPENYYIIMEYCKKGELFDYIVDHERLTEDEAAIFFYQLINGVEYIHSKGIAHRDLKPENLLLTKDKTLKIIDFGLSHEFNGNDLLKTKCGSPSYASPEILKGKPYDGFKSDIWSCGIILYAMVCGYLPFDGDTNKILFKNIMKCQPEIPDFLNDITQDLIIRILTSEPDNRITIDEIKKHKFYLRGKKLCHIDYKMIEKNILKKRKNKSSFRLNPDDNSYYLAKNDYIDEDKKYRINEEKYMDEIINVDKEIEENYRIVKTDYTGKNNKILLNEDLKELLVNKNSKSNSSNNLNAYKDIKDNNENKYYNKIEIELKENNLNGEPKKEIQKQFNEIDAIFLSKRNNHENINNNNTNNLKIIKNDENTHKNFYLNEHIKSNKLNKFLDNIRKKMNINTLDNESKLKTLKILDPNDKNTLQYKSPDKLVLNKYAPTIVINDHNHKHKININQNNHNNQIFDTIKHSFNRNMFNNSKKYLFFNNYNLSKNKNISAEHNNNILYKKSPDKITLNSINQIKLINPKNSMNKDNQNLYYNNINININNYNIKSGNKKKDNYIKNYINTENELKYKIGKHSISNLHNSKNLYLNTENNKDIFRIGNNDNNLLFKSIKNNESINDNNKERLERKLPCKTQENFFKPKKSYNFDKLSFHSINNRKLQLNKKNDLKNNILGFDNKNEQLKFRGGSEGKGIKNSYLDNFLTTINSNGIHKKRNKKIYFCGPINIKVSNNNYNLNNSQKYKFLPFMAKK